MRWLVLILLWAALPLRAEEVVLGLSQDRVAITTNFDGSDILVFGAVKRESPLLDDPLEVIITISGPRQPVVVRRKDRMFGIWVNAAHLPVSAAPTFYAVATSAPLTEVLSEVEDLRHKISVPRAIRAVGAPEGIGDAQAFIDALIRIRQSESQFQNLENTVSFRDQTLFSAAISLPANLTEGSYQTRIFLTRNGAVVSSYETAIEVNKAGLERFLYNLAHQQPLVYGLMSLAIAIIAGWLAAAVFRLVRQG